MEHYVKSCVTCQQNRTQFRKEAGMLRPLPIPTKCWESVSMDFMTHLPESKGFDSIMVVVDRVSKMAHFVPTRDTATAQEVGRLYFDKVVKHHGMQKSIVAPKCHPPRKPTNWGHVPFRSITGRKQTPPRKAVASWC